MFSAESRSANDAMTKTCLECNRVKPLDQFYAHPRANDKHQGVCKDCQKHRMKVRRLTNERAQEYDRERSVADPRRRTRNCVTFPELGTSAERGGR